MSGHERALAAFLDARDMLAERRPPGPWAGVGATIAERLTRLLDEAISSLVPDEPGIAVVAVGGYGRAELCLQSDVDLMVLHDGRATDETVRGLLYPLWDARLKVGHSVRTPKEALSAGRDSIETLTSFLGARVVGGSVELWEETDDLLAALLRRERDWIVNALKAEERARRTKEPFHLLAVDTKGGRGGLRSLRSLGWERAVTLAESTSMPEATPGEQACHDVLASVRNALHAVAGGPTDSFSFDLRQRSAQWLGEEPEAIGPVLYSTVRSVEGLVDEQWPDLMVEPTDPVRTAGRWLVRSLRGRRVAGDDVGGMATLDNVLSRGQGRLFEPLEELKLRRARSPEWTASDRAILIRLVAADRRGHEVAESLMRFGWLTKAIPELAATHAMPQSAPFHEHTVDDHQWRTVSELLAITGADSPEPWCRDLAEELGSLDELLVASLLHDVGKGRGGDHSVIGAELVEQFAARVGFASTASSMMARTVRWHLLLAEVATRRDIGNPAVVAEVASILRDPQLIRMLALLTVADSRATGRTVWSPWKASLVKALTTRLLGTFAGAAPTQLPMDELVEAADGRFSLNEIERFVTSMASGYLERFGPGEILRHMALTSPRPGEGRAAVDAEDAGEVTSLVVATSDRPGLLVVVSGVLALHGIDVLDARLAVSADGLALDTFHVTNARRAARVSEHTIGLVRRDLEKVLAGELDLAAALSQRRRPISRTVEEHLLPSVRFFTDTGTGEEIVEVRAADRPGFLHDVAAAMFEEGLDIRLAKIDTRGGRVTDTFYLRAPVRDRGHLEQRILDRVSPPA